MGSPENAPLSDQFAEIATRAREVTQGLTEAQFNWQPAQGEWSIEECLAHLTMTGQWEIGAIERAIERGKQRSITGDGSFDFGPIERFIVGQTEPPVRNKLTAWRRFVPLHGQPVTAVMPTFLHLQSQLLVQLDRARGLDFSRVKVALPISPLLRLGLGAVFSQIAAHERRHLDQARRVRERLK